MCDWTLSCNVAEHRYLRYGPTPRRLMVATATRFCDTGNDSDYGNHLNRLAVANKMDFVHLHGYELWVHDEQVTACSLSTLLRIALRSLTLRMTTRQFVCSVVTGKCTACGAAGAHQPLCTASAQLCCA